MAEYIRVVIIGGSVSSSDDLTAALSGDPSVKVVAQASGAAQGLEAVRRLRPDLVVVGLSSVLDDGCGMVEALVRLRAVRVLAVAAPPLDARDITPPVLAAGALDVMDSPNPRHRDGYERQRQALLAKVKLLVLEAPPRVAPRPNPQPAPKQQSGLSGPVGAPAPARGVRSSAPSSPAGAPAPSHRAPGSASSGPEVKVIAIVSSTGGPKALAQVLQTLPAGFKAAVVAVQHIAPGFLPGLVDWFTRECALPVRIARDGQPVESGGVWLAPDDRHLIVDRGGIMRLVDSAPVMSLRPCGDLMLESVARVYGPRSVGVVLTGMGTDGTQGLKALQAVGARTIVQDEASSAIFGMPRAAIEAGAADEILPIEAIGERLVALVCR